MCCFDVPHVLVLAAWFSMLGWTRVADLTVTGVRNMRLGASRFTDYAMPVAMDRVGKTGSVRIT